jgi:hypothetical protein
MNPRFIRIQDIRTRTWHHINVHHVVSVTECETSSNTPHWDPAKSGPAYACINMVDGTQYETDTFTVEQVVGRITKENTEWARTIDRLDLLSPS